MKRRKRSRTRRCQVSSLVRSSFARRLAVEQLEDRRMLATLTVTSAADNTIPDGLVTLREAVQAATLNTNIDTIDFAASLSGDTITLSGSQINISTALTIDASALSSILTIDANGQSRVFNIDNNFASLIDVELNGLNLTGGAAPDGTPGTPELHGGGGGHGGAILSQEALVIKNSFITGSQAGNGGIGGDDVPGDFLGATPGGIGGRGGGIYSAGSLTIENSMINDNMSGAGGRGGVNRSADHHHYGGIGGSGGGIFGSVVLVNSSVANNRTGSGGARGSLGPGTERHGGFGGGISGDTVTLLNNSSVTGNSTNGRDVRGGGIYCDNAILDNSSVSGNTTLGGNGGGILGNATLNNGSVVSGNAASYGGGIAGRATLNSGSMISGNTASYGGGIFTDSDTVTLTNSTVSGNESTFRGGGIYTKSGTVTLVGSTVTGNHTNAGNAEGGGIFTDSGAVTLTNSLVTGNLTEGEDAEGGGIYAVSGDVILTDSRVSGNRTEGYGSDGAGIFAGTGNVTMIGSTVSANRTEGSNSSGGGVFTHSGDLRFTNSTVSGNRTLGAGSQGGGVATALGSVILVSSTVTDNRTEGSSTDGGGIYLSDTPIQILNRAVVIKNSIVADNTVTQANSSAPDLRHGFLNTILSVRYSLIGDNEGTTLAEAQTPDAAGNLIGSAAGAGKIASGLLPLADNGGPTLPGGADVRTHALASNSPAIDAGSNAIAVSDDLFVDQRGELRFIDGNFDLVTTIDMGAYERQVGFVPAFVVSTTEDDVDGDFSSGDFSLREIVLFANNLPGADTITFAAALAGQTITLGGTELEITEAVTIDATSSGGQVTVDANGQSRVINFSADTGNLALAGLTIAGGKTTGDNTGFSDSTYSGGGIRFLSSGTLSLTGSTVSGNSTGGDFALGGGIYSTSGDVTLNSSTISGNHTEGTNALGGGIWSDSGDLSLTSSTVSDNYTTRAYSNGGGISTGSGDLVLTNSTVSGNRTKGNSSGGGGISAVLGSVTLTSSTVTDNRTEGFSSDGGGIRLGPLFLGDLRIDSSIIAGNTVTQVNSSAPDLKPGSAVLDIDYTLIGDTTGLNASQVVALNNGSGNLLNQAAQLEALADNGGPTQTHALLPGSPAIDGGNPSPFSAPATDQRGTGFARIVDGDGDTLAVIDIGAFEVQAAPSMPSADFDDNGTIDGFDFLAWQRGFGITSGAKLADGDANRDGDVDASDLAVWEATFGEVESTPLVGEQLAVSTVSTEPQQAAFSQDVVASKPTASVPAPPQVEPPRVEPPRVEPVLSAELIDAALAFDLALDVAAKAESPADELSSSTPAAYDTVVANDQFAPVPRFADEHELPVTIASDAEDTEDAIESELWLSDKLLERVFG